MKATTVLTNGHIYTLDSRRPIATALAISDNKILAVGDDAAIKSLLDSDGEWIDLQGRAVTPGLVDAHVHFQWYSLYRQQIDLAGAATLEESLERVAHYLAQRRQAGQPIPPGEWLQGRGWSQADWPGEAFPTAADLDRVTPHNPILLQHKSGHAAWANSLALQAAGIDDATPNPAGGEIQRDEQGRATGVFLESAIDLVSRHIPPASEAQLMAAMRQAQEHCWSAGLTGLHDFDGRACFHALQSLRQNGELGLRIVKNIPAYRFQHAVEVGLRSGFGDEWLRIGGVKIFADGALGPRTAAMLAPYEGEPDNRGIVVTDKEEMMAIASQASAAGLSVTIHAIGDRANHDVLDVYEFVRAEEQERAGQQTTPAGKLRHRIEHVQVIHPDDLNRLAQLDVIASMQPIHATSDMFMADRYWGERARYSYAWRSLLESGALLTFGSDAPIEGIEPLPGLHAAVTRRRAGGQPGPEGWYPEQRLNLAEAVHAFTMAAAMTSGQEDRFGSITAGKLADLTIYDRDIFAIPPDELLETQIAGVMVDGQFRFRALL